MTSRTPTTRRRFGGRQPLCGIGVTSLIIVISRPAACSERIAASRPAPGPLTSTSVDFMPCSIALRAAASAAICAANGVDFFDPLKPKLPAEAHEIDAAVRIADRHDGVVERRVHVRDARRTFLTSRFCRDLVCFLAAKFSPLLADSSETDGNAGTRQGPRSYLTWRTGTNARARYLPGPYSLELLSGYGYRKRNPRPANGPL